MEYITTELLRISLLPSQQDIYRSSRYFKTRYYHINNASFYTTSVFNRIKKIIPPITETEKITIAEQCLWIEIFFGKVNHKDYKYPRLGKRVFSHSELEDLASKFPSQQIYPDKNNNCRGTLEYLGENGYFALGIDKEYEGKRTTVEEMSEMLAYITSVSPSLGVVVMVLILLDQ